LKSRERSHARRDGQEGGRCEPLLGGGEGGGGCQKLEEKKRIANEVGARAVERAGIQPPG